ncbi:hypothetical protein BH20CHL7_BH20CHL7_17520 [soil metagenome]
MTIRVSFANWCRTTRLDLDITQQDLADAVGVSRSHIAAIEAGRANPTVGVMDRIGATFGIDLELRARPPLLIGGGHARDRLHALCSGYSGRRVGGSGLLVAREVEIREGRVLGWIDLLAFDPRTGLLLVIEVKTALDDIGRLERQLGWYERMALRTDIAAAWRPTEVRAWCLVLATAAADTQMSLHRDVLRTAFPVRAGSMVSVLAGGPALPGRGIALIDPGSRRRDWLIPSRSDGRRWPAPYPDPAGAAAVLAARARG